MRILLDTCCFLWLIAGDDKLSSKAKDLITDPNNECLLSSVSLWEIAIKISKGKLSLTGSYETIIPHQLKINNIALLNIEIDHTIKISKLGFYEDHKDPFDRMLIAQSIIENIPVLSADAKFDLYDDVGRIW